MRPLVYLAGTAAIADGVLHLLFPERWNALWIAETRRFLPGVGQSLERFFQQAPAATQRAQGFVWIALGALLLWWAGPVEVTPREEAPAFGRMLR